MKEIRNKNSSATQMMITLACLVVVVAGLKLASSLCIPILLAFFIATVSFPVTRWLRERGVPRFFAVLVTVMVDFVLIGGVIVFLVMTVGQLRSRWQGEYLPMIEKKIGQGREIALDYMVKMGNDPKESERQINEVLSDESMRNALQGVEAQSWWDVSKSVLDFVLGVFGTTFIVVLLTIFMLNEARMFGRRMNSVFAARGPNFHRVLTACKDIQKYLGIKTVVSGLTGLCAYALCFIMQVDFPELWGLLAFALNYIPAIGSVVAGLPPVLLALLMRDVQTALIVAGGYLAINASLGNFLEPMLLGRRFGISTLVVVFSVLFWGWVWGPVGMFLGVPLTMLLKVGLDNSTDFRWLAVAITKEENSTAAEEIIIKEAAEPKGEVST